jgi:hypothetical protein
MCDYSLHAVAFRPASAGDKLVSKIFDKSVTRGFAAVGEPAVAVCLLPGTEVAFDAEVKYENFFALLPKRTITQRTARFRKVNLQDHYAHHDALEFPDGKIVLLTRLCPGQLATVLQLPAHQRPAEDTEKQVNSIAPAPIDAGLPPWLSMGA